jgi:hypothetical protein
VQLQLRQHLLYIDRGQRDLVEAVGLCGADGDRRLHDCGAHGLRRRRVGLLPIRLQRLAERVQQLGHVERLLLIDGGGRVLRDQGGLGLAVQAFAAELYGRRLELGPAQ